MKNLDFGTFLHEIQHSVHCDCGLIQNELFEILLFSCLNDVVESNIVDVYVVGEVEHFDWLKGVGLAQVHDAVTVDFMIAEMQFLLCKISIRGS